MARRGGFAHNYDAAAMYRLTSDETAMAALRQRVSAEILDAVEQTIDQIAAELTDAHGVPEDAVRLFVAQRAAEATDFLRWVKAGEARGAGVPVRGLMDAMGYSSPTSISRMVPTLDHVAAVRARVDATGTRQLVHDDRGYSMALLPRENAEETVTQARKRGWLPDDVAEPDDQDA